MYGEKIPYRPVANICSAPASSFAIPPPWLRKQRAGKKPKPPNPTVRGTNNLCELRPRSVTWAGRALARKLTSRGAVFYGDRCRGRFWDVECSRFDRGQQEGHAGIRRGRISTASQARGPGVCDAVA